MSGNVIVAIGIGMIMVAIGLFMFSLIYRNTTGKRIREELDREYSSDYH